MMVDDDAAPEAEGSELLLDSILKTENTLLLGERLGGVVVLAAEGCPIQNSIVMYPLWRH